MDGTLARSSLRTASARMTLAAAALGFFIVVLDTMIVNVALPAMGRDLGASVAGLQWVVDGYTVMFAALLLSSGALADRLGATRAFDLGLLAFGGASAACALAPSLEVLLGARVLQGMAAALVLPASLALVRQAFDDTHERARAVAVWTAAGGAAVAAGPVLGGALTSGLDWRWVFIVNLPVCAVALTALRRMPPSASRPAGVDVLGQLTAAATVACLTLGVIEAGHAGLGSRLAVTGLLLAALGAGAFLAIEQRVAMPIVPLGLFAAPFVVPATLAGFMLNFALYGQVFVLGLYFQDVLGHSAVHSGLLFLPMTIVITFFNLLSGRMSARYGARVPLLTGQLLIAGGLLALVAVDRSTPLVMLELLLIPLGTGGGLAVPALTTALMDALPAHQAGVAAGVINAARQLGAALGVAVCGALLSDNFVAGMHLAVGLSAAGVIATAALAARAHRVAPR